METIFGKTIRQRAEETKNRNPKTAALTILSHAWCAVKAYPIDPLFMSKKDAQLANQLICAKIERIQRYVGGAK